MSSQNRNDSLHYLTNSTAFNSVKHRLLIAYKAWIEISNFPEFVKIYLTCQTLKFGGNDKSCSSKVK
jgi:hypothetical protein